ncbi:MAG: glycosyltransferase family 2 protein [Kangiellaceae bacterium]|nr:glycosyltransferase family 2 protein [Kangiellaceae bacterium]
MTYSPCIIIPNYNHAEFIEQVIGRLLPFQLPIIMVNDGSNQQTRSVLTEIEAKHPQVTLVHLEVNQGKGGAVMEGMRKATEMGFSHALQIDADGQHNLKDVPKFIELSKKNPLSVICGIPIYDHSVPLGRLIPRYITHFWVWVETLSFTIKDSMCGYRLYPLETTTQLINSSTIGRRMDFDTEILVRLYWQQVNIISLPTKVTYPEEGSSHFNLLKDNWLITKMHTRLFFGMLRRFPSLIKHKFATRKGKQQHWSSIEERGSSIGIGLLVWLYRVFGQWIFRLFLIPIIGYFVLTGKDARKASYQYWHNLYVHQNRKDTVKWTTVYNHFYQFGLSAIDKIRAWLGDIKRSDVTIHGQQHFDFLLEQQQGAVFIASHLGNTELCRALGTAGQKYRINALVFTKHALKFQAILSKINPQSQINLIQVDAMGADTAILLKDKVDQGEIVIIVGDRTSITNYGRVEYADFLGQKAPFSQGPFILASVLDCPVFLLFCTKQQGRYHVYLEPFADSLKFARNQRQQQLQYSIQKYAHRLQDHCIKAPDQWFNFYNFWQQDDSQYIERTFDGKHQEK